MARPPVMPTEKKTQIELANAIFEYLEIWHN